MTVLKVVKTLNVWLTTHLFVPTIQRYNQSLVKSSKMKSTLNQQGIPSLLMKWRKPLKSTTETCVVPTSNTHNITSHQHMPWCLHIRTLCHVFTMETCTQMMVNIWLKNHHIMMLLKPSWKAVSAMQLAVKIWRLTTSDMVILMVGMLQVSWLLYVTVQGLTVLLMLVQQKHVTKVWQLSFQTNLPFV